MRVLHVIPFLWSGAGRVLTDLCAAQTLHHNVAIVTSDKSKGMADWPSYRRQLSAAGVRHHLIDFFDRDAAVYWNGVEKLGALISEWRPDVVHCHSGVPACAVAVIRDRGKNDFRFIAQLHSWGLDRPAWMNTMDLWGFSRADCVIANAGSYRKILMDSGIPRQKIKVVPWGVETESFDAAPRQKRKRARVGFVGRIEPRKGQLELVRAFDLLRAKRDDSRLDLVGPTADPSYKREIERFVRLRGLNRHVRLTGKVRDVNSWLSNWDLFVSLSTDEGQGMAVLEAMAAGVPVVARSCPGIQDYLRDGENGIVLKSAAPSKVARCLALALNHPEQLKKISVQARSMVADKFSWKRTVVDMEMLYGN